MKKVWLGIAVVAMGISACNFTVGECWPNGHGGSAEVGPGAVGAVGVGGYGDTPPRGGTGANACNASSDSPSDNPPTRPPDQGGEPLDIWLNCKGLDAVQCMEKCADAGAPCAPRRKHPKKSDGGWGDLYMCKTGEPSHVCSYYYANGDECIFLKALGGEIPWCVYIGGKP